MKVESEIKKWGNSLALRVTGVMAEMPRLAAGTRVIVEVSEAGLVVKPASRRKGRLRFPFSESELLAELDARTAHADALAEPRDAEVGT